MPMLLKHTQLLLFIGIVFLTTACLSSDTSIYKQDAVNFCGVFDEAAWEELYNDNNWKATNSNESLNDIEGEWYGDVLRKKIDSAVETPEFKELTDHILSTNFIANIYPSTKEKIEALTGEQWDCENIDSFYRHIVYKSWGADQEPDSSIEIKTADIEMTKDGNFLFFGQKLSLNSEDDIKTVLLDKKSLDDEIVIKVHNQFNESNLISLLNLLDKIGYKKFTSVRE